MRLDSNENEASEQSDVDEYGRRNRRKSSFYQHGDEHEGKHLDEKDRAYFEDYLEHKLKSTRKIICQGMVFAIEHAQNSQSISTMIYD